MYFILKFLQKYEARPEDRVILRLTEKSDKTFDFVEVGKGADLEGLVLDQGDVYIIDTGMFFISIL